MTSRRFLQGVAFLATAAALAAPLGADGRKPDPETPYTDVLSRPLVPPGSTGWGKGSVTLPAGEQVGLLVGLVTQCDGACRYVIEAELSGFMPSSDLTSDIQYWWGGVYGRLQELRAPAPGEKEAPWLRVEGTWRLEKDLEGTFSAEVYGCNEAGTEYVCGRIEGRFEVSQAVPGPVPYPCNKDFDVPPIAKAKLLGLRPFDGADTGTIVCPKGPDFITPPPPQKASPGCRKDFDVPPIAKAKLVGSLPVAGADTGTIVCPKGPDFATPPPPQKASPGCRKDLDVPPIAKAKLVGSLPVAGADTGTIVCPKGPDYVAADPGRTGTAPAGAAPCMAGWRDARSSLPAAWPFATPPHAWPILSGTFDLRYQLYE